MMFYTPSQKRSQKAQEEILSTENHEIAAGFPVFPKKHTFQNTCVSIIFVLICLKFRKMYREKLEKAEFASCD